MNEERYTSESLFGNMEHNYALALSLRINNVKYFIHNVEIAVLVISK